MRLGIMQGRLVEPVNGHIQQFPEKEWALEFERLNELNLHHVEWLITKECFLSNPLMSVNYDLQSYSISSICADNLVDTKIYKKIFLQENLVPLCQAALRNRIDNITIPLLEDSDLNDDQKRKSFIAEITKIAKRFPALNFTFEAELEPTKLLEILGESDNFYVTYDTGNITSCGFNHFDYIKLFSNKINNVHLKDRTLNGQTVRPTTGDTNFKEIFTTLNKMKYNGYYTIQTARGKTGNELFTIQEHKRIFEKMYEDNI